MENDKIITLAIYNFEKAQMLKSYLELEGVECFLENVNLIQGAVSSGVKVRINETNLEKALGLLDALRESEFRAHLIKRTGAARILVPVDFTPHSYSALDVAFDWALKLNAELTVLHSYFTPILNAIPFGENFAFDINTEELVTDIREDAEKGMAKVQTYLEDKNSLIHVKKVSVKFHLANGIAEEEIVRYSNTYHPTLIVMGTRSKDKKSNELIGSVTAEVIDMTNYPVLVIPEVFAYSGMSAFKNLLYATNFDDDDLNALQKLEDIIKPLEVNIHCAHIGVHKDSKWDEVKLKGLREHLLRKYKESKIVCNLVESADYWKGFEEYILNNQIDLVSITTHRRGFLSRIMNPSISKKMLFHTDLPLLVFHG